MSYPSCFRNVVFRCKFNTISIAFVPRIHLIHTFFHSNIIQILSKEKYENFTIAVFPKVDAAVTPWPSHSHPLLVFVISLCIPRSLAHPPTRRRQTIEFHLVYVRVCNVCLFFTMIFRNNLDVLCVRTLHLINLPIPFFFIFFLFLQKQENHLNSCRNECC